MRSLWSLNTDPINKMLGSQEGIDYFKFATLEISGYLANLVMSKSGSWDRIGTREVVATCSPFISETKLHVTVSAGSHQLLCKGVPHRKGLPLRFPRGPADAAGGGDRWVARHARARGTAQQFYCPFQVALCPSYYFFFVILISALQSSWDFIITDT